MSNAQLAKPDVDQVRLYMLFVLFGGDAKRVSAVSHIDVSIIESLAHDFGWKAKANAKQQLDTDEGKEYERAINRVATYVSAEQLGQVFGNVISALNSDPEYARAFCTEIDDEGRKSYSTKNLVELAKGLEIVSNVKYRALGDKMAAAADVTGNSPQSVTNITLNVYKALANRFDRNLAIDTSAEVLRSVPAAEQPVAEPRKAEAV
jgi:hypothetical protein